MGRKNNSKKRNNTSKKQSVMKMMGMSTKIPFNFVYGATFSASSTVSLSIAPRFGFDTLIANIGSNFQFYRFTKLMFKALPAQTNYVFTYYPSEEATPSGDSFTTVSVAALNRLSSAGTTVPIMLNVPRKLLYQTPEDWWGTSSTSAIPTQGRLAVAVPVAYTGTIYFQITGLVEFKAPSASGLGVPPPLTGPTNEQTVVALTVGAGVDKPATSISLDVAHCPSSSCGHCPGIKLSG